MTAPAAQPLAPELAKQLAQLKDIHLPPAISWWPLAPGWWLLAAAVVLALAGVGLAVYLRRRSVRYRALGELAVLRRDEDLAVAPMAARIAVLLKRIVQQKDDTRALAAAHGGSWAERLTQDPGGMPAAVARFIAVAPYAGTAAMAEAPDRAALLSAADRWIRRNA